jgi:hypothetical protein
VFQIRERGEEPNGLVALGPVGLGHIADIVRTRIKKRSLAVHLQGGDKGVSTLRTVAWSTWSSVLKSGERLAWPHVQVAVGPLVEAVANAGRN